MQEGSGELESPSDGCQKKDTITRFADEIASANSRAGQAPRTPPEARILQDALMPSHPSPGRRTSDRLSLRAMASGPSLPWQLLGIALVEVKRSLTLPQRRHRGKLEVSEIQTTPLLWIEVGWTWAGTIDLAWSQGQGELDEIQRASETRWVSTSSGS